MKDLKKGDLIKRKNTCIVYPGIKNGEIYTFEAYDSNYPEKFLLIKECITPLYSENFEKVEKESLDFSKTPPCVHQTPEEKEIVAKEIVENSPLAVGKKIDVKWTETGVPPVSYFGPTLTTLPTDNDLRTPEQKGATKHDSGKPSFSAIPQLALMEVAKGFTHGITNYGRYNYSKPMKLSRLIDAGERHGWKTKTFFDINDIDPETGVHHLALVACNALMALDQILTGQIIDDRNPAYAKPKE